MLVAEKLKKSLLDLIYSDRDDDLFTPTLQRRPVTHEFYEKVIILELDRKGDLVDESEEEGNIEQVYNTYLRKILGLFVYRQILIDAIKALYSEKYSFEELKAYAKKILATFTRFGVFTDDRRIALVVINNKKLIYVNNEVIDLSSMRAKKLPYTVDVDILDPKSFKKYAKPLPYSKIRVIYFGTYKPEKRLFKSTRAVDIKFGYLTAVVSEDWEVVKLGGEKNEATLEYGLVPYDELYTSSKQKIVRQMLLYVYDKLSPSARKSIDAMTRKKNQLYENLVLYLSNASLTARGVYVFRYSIKTGEKKEGNVFFVQIGGVRRVEQSQTTPKAVATAV